MGNGDHNNELGILGHQNVETTMIYTHVMNKGGRGVTSPLDQNAQNAERGNDPAGQPAR
jgi:site-specific recombinase XerC